MVLEQGLAIIRKKTVDPNKAKCSIKVLLVLGPLSRDDGKQSLLIVWSLGVDDFKDRKKDSKEAFVQTILSSL